MGGRPLSQIFDHLLLGDVESELLPEETERLELSVLLRLSREDSPRTIKEYVGSELLDLFVRTDLEKGITAKTYCRSVHSHDVSHFLADGQVFEPLRKQHQRTVLDHSLLINCATWIRNLDGGEVAVALETLVGEGGVEDNCVEVNKLLGTDVCLSKSGVRILKVRRGYIALFLMLLHLFN